MMPSSLTIGTTAAARRLFIGEGHDLPASVVTEKLAILAQSGAGKTYAGMRLAEVLLTVAPIIVFDPVGVWWGLRSSADGTGPGLPVTIFGGDHADLPLSPKDGLALGWILAERATPAILDVSDLTDDEVANFTADFAEAFYQTKKRHRSPVHLIFDEAQDFLPQMPESKAAVRMLGKVVRLLRKGRSAGVGWTLITQQPQDTNKRGLNQAGTILAMRTVGEHERRAIAAWVTSKVKRADAIRLVDTLPSLETGVAHVWSPTFLKLDQTVRIERRWTFDSSRTPDVDERQLAAQTLAPVDLDQLREALKQASGQPLAGDAQQLKHRIAELERRNQELEQQLRDADVNADIALLRLQETLDEVRACIGGPRRTPTLKKPAARLDAPLSEGLRPSKATPAPQRGPALEQVGTVTTPPPSGVLADENSSLLAALPKGARTMLQVLASTMRPHLTPQQIATLSGMKVTGGTFAKYLSLLKKWNYVRPLPSTSRKAGSLQISDEGRALAGVRPTPMNTAGLVALWSARLPAGARQMLAELVRVYPEELSRKVLAQRVGMESRGGTWGKYLSLLRSNGLVVSNGELLTASPIFFPVIPSSTSGASS